MVRQIGVATSLIAIVAFGFLPAGEECLASASLAHPCCGERPAQPETTRGASCCAGGGPPAAPAPETGERQRCDCLHAPEAPAAVMVGTSAIDRIAGASAAALPDVLAVQREPRAEPGGRPAPLPRSAPPPLFVVDCAFLI